MWIKSWVCFLVIGRGTSDWWRVLWLTGLCPVLSQAACLSHLTLEPLSAASVYDVFSPAPYALVQHFRIRAEMSGSVCKATVALKMDNGQSVLTNRLSSSHQMQFEWYGSSGARQGNRWITTLSAATPEATFQIRLPGGQWAEAGEYTGLLKAALTEGNDMAESDQSTAELMVRAVIRPEVRLQFYGLNQRHYMLDMGTLSSGKVIRTAPQLWVRSTSAYRLAIGSEHQGQLRHQSDDPQWDISYQLSVANQQMPLNHSRDQGYQGQSSPGQILPLQLVIGDTQRKPGGRYQDTLHLSMTPSLAQTP